jgi:hypothetical protein
MRENMSFRWKVIISPPRGAEASPIPEGFWKRLQESVWQAANHPDLLPVLLSGQSIP